MKLQMNFSITQLEYIWAVYQLGHFGKAAEYCHVTQPTLSMQIQKFESDLGAVIFDRSKKPILLTEVGEKIITQVKAVLNEAKKIPSLIEATQSSDVSGLLTFAVIPTIAPYLLPRILPHIEKKFSNLKLKIIEMQTEHIIKELESDNVDVGLLAIPVGIQKLIEQPLYYEQFYLLGRRGDALPKGKKVNSQSLELSQMWLLEEGHCLRNQVLDLCRQKKDKQITRRFDFESGSLETLKNLVSMYGGYTLLPSLAAEDIRSNVVLKAFEKPIPSRQVGLIYQREHYKQRLIQALAEVILEVIPEEVKKTQAKDLDLLDVLS